MSSKPLHPEFLVLRQMRRAREANPDEPIDLTVICGDQEKETRFVDFRPRDRVLVASFGNVERFVPLRYVRESWRERTASSTRHYVDVTADGWRIMARGSLRRVM